MKKRTPEILAKLASLPTTGLGGAPEGFETVRDFLQRFGYLGGATDAKAASAVLDGAISSALAKYQHRHRLNPSGIFDESTKQMMMMPKNSPRLH